MRSEKSLLSNRRAGLRRLQRSCMGQNLAGNQATKKTKGDLNAAKRAEWKAKQVVYDAKCKKLKRQGVPKLQWPHASWYPFGKKSYEEWLAEGDRPEYDKTSFDEVPSWEASNSEEGSTE